MFEVCSPEPHFHVFARVLVTNAGKVYCLPTLYLLHEPDHKILAERDLEFSFATFKMADQCEATDCTDGEVLLPFGKTHRS